MSKEQLKALVEKVASDTELSDKIGAATTAEAVIEIAKAAGFSITSEDIQLLLSLLSEVSEEEEELTDDDLENVAGGWGNGWANDAFGSPQRWNVDKMNAAIDSRWNW